MKTFTPGETAVSDVRVTEVITALESEQAQAAEPPWRMERPLGILGKAQFLLCHSGFRIH